MASLESQVSHLPMECVKLVLETCCVRKILSRIGFATSPVGERLRPSPHDQANRDAVLQSAGSGSCDYELVASRWRIGRLLAAADTASRPRQH